MTFSHVCCLLAAAFLSSGSVLSSDTSVDQLKTLCEDQASNDIDFKSVKSFESLLDEFSVVTPECLRKYGSSFEALSSLLSDEQLRDDLCGEHAYDLIRKFHTRFISIYVPEMNREELVNRTSAGEWTLSSATAETDKNPFEPIPVALRKFFIIFVKQINVVCKRKLVERLMELETKNIVANDFKVMEGAREDSTHILLDTSISKNILLKPSKDTIYGLQMLDHSKYRGIDPRDIKLYVQVKFNSRLTHIQDLCLKKFKPIYDELFAPVIRLNNLAYIEHSEFADDYLEREPYFTKWYPIIETCELFKDVEVLQDSSSLSALADILRDISPTSAKQTNTIRIYTRREADEIKARIARDSKARGAISAFEPGRSHVEHEKVKITELPWVEHFKGDGDKKVRDFERQIRKLIAKKSSQIDAAISSSIVWVKYILKKNRIEFASKNEDTSAGALAVFMERHGVKLRLFGLTIGFLMFGIAFG